MVTVRCTHQANVLLTFLAVVQVLPQRVVVAGKGKRARVFVLHKLYQLDGVQVPRDFVVT